MLTQKVLFYEKLMTETANRLWDHFRTVSASIVFGSARDTVVGTVYVGTVVQGTRVMGYGGVVRTRVVPHDTPPGAPFLRHTRQMTTPQPGPLYHHSREP